MRGATRPRCNQSAAFACRNSFIRAFAAPVVNPDPLNWHGWPYLTREYHHLLQFGGQGSATALGDTGWIDANGPHPGNGIQAMGWAIAFN